VNRGAGRLPEVNQQTMPAGHRRRLRRLGDARCRAAARRRWAPAGAAISTRNQTCTARRLCNSQPTSSRRRAGIQIVGAI